MRTENNNLTPPLATGARSHTSLAGAGGESLESVNMKNSNQPATAKAAKTEAQNLLKKIRDGQGNGVAITSFYWGTAADYNNGKYNFWDYCPKFGGMNPTRSRTIPAKSILECGNDLQKLQQLIQPRTDMVRETIGETV